MQVGLRIAFLRMYEVRKFNGVADKEDGRIVTDDIVISVFRIEFDCETARVAGGIRRTAFAADR